MTSELSRSVDARGAPFSFSYRENNQLPPGRGSPELLADAILNTGIYPVQRGYWSHRAVVTCTWHTYFRSKLIRGWETRNSNCRSSRQERKNPLSSHEGAKGEKKTTGKRWKERIDNEKTTYRVLWIRICTRHRERERYLQSHRGCNEISDAANTAQDEAVILQSINLLGLASCNNLFDAESSFGYFPRKRL